jgi:outer membrane protein insertion porin family
MPIPISCRQWSRLPGLCAAFLTIALLALLLGASGVATAQPAPLTDIDARTQVRSINFRFVDQQTFAETRLKEQIALSEPGALAGIRRAFAWLPIIPPVGVHPFVPIDLARDAVRLERFYQRNGFLYPDVDWLVRLDGDRNVVTILFTIQEGPPLLLDDLDYRGPDGRLAREHVAPGLRDDWEDFKRREGLATGQRLDEFGVIQLEEAALTWLRDRGYAFADVASIVRVDSLASRARVSIRLDPGPQARISQIVVEGNETVSERAVRRELPFRAGDPFSQRRLREGQREVFGLNIFQIALAEVPEQPVDSLVMVRVRVRERNPRVLSAQVGYMSQAGLAGEVEWRHRNFLGDARTLTIGLLGNTGWLALTQDPERRYRGSVSLRQPYVFHRRLSANVTAFADRRDDRREESRTFGAEGTLFYELGQFRNLATTYRFENRLVQDFRIGSTRSPNLVSLLDTDLDLIADLDPEFTRSLLSLDATYGTVDDPVNPRLGYVLRPNVQFTLPFPAGGLEYTRGRVTGTGYVPVGDRLTFASRASVGRLFLPDVDTPDPAVAFGRILRLGDAAFLAGGTGDVRGWPPGGIGPKVLNALIDTTAAEPTLFGDRYFPLGGTTRATATAELRYQATELAGAFAFFDAGRLWTPQEGYRLAPGDPLFDRTYADTDRIFFGTGAGISLASPVGAIQVALGYKINPSFFDVRHPRDITAAFQRELRQNPDAGPDDLRRAAETVEPSPWRRLHLHLSIGQTF